jgi:hypothetical protein
LIADSNSRQEIWKDDKLYFFRTPPTAPRKAQKEPPSLPVIEK